MSSNFARVKRVLLALLAGCALLAVMFVGLMIWIASSAIRHGERLEARVPAAYADLERTLGEDPAVLARVGPVVEVTYEQIRRSNSISASKMGMVDSMVLGCVVTGELSSDTLTAYFSSKNGDWKLDRWQFGYDEEVLETLQLEAELKEFHHNLETGRDSIRLELDLAAPAGQEPATIE